MLPEDRLQMKWRASEGGGLGYLVQVKPVAGKGPAPPPAVRAGSDSGQQGSPSASSCVSAPMCPCDSAFPPVCLPSLTWGWRPSKFPSLRPHVWHMQKALSQCLLKKL